MLNLNKLFPRLSISTKLIIAFLALVILPLVTYGIYSIISMSRSFEDQALRKLQFQIDTISRDMSDFLGNVQQDLRYLASLSSLKEFAKIQSNGRVKSNLFKTKKSVVERDFLQFSKGKRTYYQIRYISASGQEIVRLNRGKTGAYVVAQSHLQNKSSRYYIQEALQTPPDQIYVSPMDMNVERGIVEIPLKPVVRYAIVITDKNNIKQGILVINLFAKSIFEIIGGVPEEAGSYLTDKGGLYLYQSSGSTGFNYFRNRSLYDDYSENVAKQILHTDRGLIHTQNLILAHSRITLSKHAAETWLLLVSMPKDVVFAAVYKLKTGLVGILIILVISASFLGLIAARQFTRPIYRLTHGADLIARGEFGHNILVQTNDELEDLAGHFNQMAKQLGDSHTKMQRWNENLQNEVAKRTAELVLSEEQLKIEKQKLDDIISSIGAELCLIDRQKSVVWVNKVLADRCGGESLAIGKPCHELFNNNGKECTNCRCEVNFQKRRPSKMVMSRRNAKDEEKIYQVVSTPVIDVDNQVSQILEMHLDITESVLKERALEKQKSEKVHLASQVQMAAGVIHEVAKPLASIKTTIQVLNQEMENDEQRMYFDGVEKEIDQLSGFLKTFSKYARPRPLQLETCHLAHVVNQVKILIEKDALQRNIELKISDLDSLPELKLDSIQLQQALLNICINAFEAMPQGGKLQISATLAGKNKQHVQVTISDSGAGIAKEKLAKIFDPFYSDKSDGTGLGLTIVRQIIENHDGNIQVKSGKTTGTQFIFTLPVHSSS